MLLRAHVKSFQNFFFHHVPLGAPYDVAGVLHMNRTVA